MISANNVTLRIGKKALFEDVNIKFVEGQCYGLIGANGAGKSTFLKILTGQLEPSKGDVSITPGQRLSFLEQDQGKYDDQPVLDTVIQGNQRLYEIMKETDGIYGGRFSGAGFKGCCMALVDPEKVDSIREEVERKYLTSYPEMTGKYSFHLCKSADGIGANL